MVGHLAPDLGAALASGRALVFGLLRVDLPAPAAPLCLLTGSGEVPFGGVTYIGQDDRFGSLVSLDPPEDGSDDSAPSMSFEIAAPSDAAAITLASASYQGSRVRLWISAIISDLGAYATPYGLFDGVLDVPHLEIDKGTRTLTFDCVSGFEALFADTEGQRLADASHKAIHPDENGFQWVTGVNRQILWGPGERPGNALSYGGSRGEEGGFGDYGIPGGIPGGVRNTNLNRALF
jgi:hypothetical protein